MIESKEIRKANEDALKKQNFAIFGKAFPGQEKYKLDKEKTSKRVSLAFLPDTYFLTFLVNMLLIISVLVFFFSTRNVSEEYFIRKNIINMFEKETHRTPVIKTEADADDRHQEVDLQPFSKISSQSEFDMFMNQTIPYTVFSIDPKSRRLAFSD